MSGHPVSSTEFVPSRTLNVARTSRNLFTALSTEWISLHWLSQHTGSRRYYVKIFCAEFHCTDLYNTQVLEGTTWRSSVPNFAALTFSTHSYSKVLREDLLCRISLHWPSQHSYSNVLRENLLCRISLHWPSQHAGCRRYYVKIFCAEFHCTDLHNTQIVAGNT